MRKMNKKLRKKSLFWQHYRERCLSSLDNIYVESTYLRVPEKRGVARREKAVRACLLPLAMNKF